MMTDHTITFRIADEADIPLLLDLYRSLDVKGEIPLSESCARTIFSEMQKNGVQKIHLAFCDKQCVGTFVLTILPYLVHAGQKAAILEDVVVHPDFRSQGIGRQMTLWVLEQSRLAGCYKLALSSNQIRTEAHRFYEREGFTLHGYSYQTFL